MFTRLLLAVLMIVSPAQAGAADTAAAIRARLAAIDVLPGGLSAVEEADLAALYEPAGYAPLWIDDSGGPGQNARQALLRLKGAHADGLDPGDYADERLAVLLGALATRERRHAAAVADFDVTLSAAFLRYLRHLHLGRLDPRTMGFRLIVPAEGHDFVTLLRSAVHGGRIHETADELAPPLAQYRLLREMLARYRMLARDASLEPAPPVAGILRPGDAYPHLDALGRRLAAVGDLTAGEFETGGRYEGPIVDAVKRFQVRHGLTPDGILGKATQAALRVPLAWRVRQIELALERLRWLPDLGTRRFVALNIPMFHLWAWDSAGTAGAPALDMRAIVGRALSTETPVFVEEMRDVIFRPYWNVPRSILRNEILPMVTRDPDSLRRQAMEIVRGAGDDAVPVPATAGNLALLRQGMLRLRQRPGPHNALGLVKFVFPNNENVYLHGTPAQELFARTRRDFSHGCVRVEDPVGLAEWVLKEEPGWTRDRIRGAVAGPSPQRVHLQRPIQVILFYVTAIVMPVDGTIRFVEDIYRHDARLERALADPD